MQTSQMDKYTISCYHTGQLFRSDKQHQTVKQTYAYLSIYCD